MPSNITDVELEERVEDRTGGSWRARSGLPRATTAVRDDRLG